MSDIIIQGSNMSLMKTIPLSDFIECYRPVCNNCTPYPDGVLKTALGPVIWDRRDYSRIGNELSNKSIWTIMTLGDDIYYIVAGIKLGLNQNIVGYIVTDVPYETKQTFLLKTIVR